MTSQLNGMRIAYGNGNVYMLMIVEELTWIGDFTLSRARFENSTIRQKSVVSR